MAGWQCLGSTGIENLSHHLKDDHEYVPSVQALGDEERCAQVHPYKLTTALMQSAAEQGTEVIQGEVQGIEWRDLDPGCRSAVGEIPCHNLLLSSDVTGALVDGRLVEADVLVLAMGPWSIKASEWLPIPPTSAKKYHSIVVTPKRDMTPDVIFLNHITSEGRKVEPEIYPRPDGKVYICGEPQSVPLPEDPEQVTVDLNICRRLQSTASEAIPSLRHVRQISVVIVWMDEQRMG